MREITQEETDEVFGRYGQMVPSRDLGDGDVFMLNGREEICRGKEWGYVQYGGPYNEFSPDSVPEVEYVGRATRIPQKPGPIIVLFSDPQ